jgi:receptor protein-tyrosine kinase
MSRLKVTSASQGDTVTTEIGSTLGQQLVQAGKISTDDVSRIIVAQRESGHMFGEAAVSLGLLSPDELQRALAQQFAYPYVDVTNTNISRLLAAAHRPFGKEAEAFRGLRSELMLRWFDDNHKVISITSPRGNQGSSSVAANLAISFAQLGERVLLIDANMRFPAHHELFGIGNGNGLSTLLRGRTALKDAVTPVAPFESLSVMTAGPTPPNPQELLGRVSFSYLIETAPAIYDIIIIDTPPLLEYADAQVVAEVTGGCLVSTRRNNTKMADLESAKLQIAPTGAQLVGVVMNA